MFVLALPACADSSPRAEEGAALYHAYCASCHGASGEGDGPVARELARAPVDLTGIARRDGGHFKVSKVLTAIDGRYEIAAHGPREMPVWGAIFLDAHVDEPLPIHRGMDDARALVDFLQTLQVMADAVGDEPPGRVYESHGSDRTR